MAPWEQPPSYFGFPCWIVVFPTLVLIVEGYYSSSGLAPLRIKPRCSTIIITIIILFLTSPSNNPISTIHICNTRPHGPFLGRFLKARLTITRR